MVPLWIKKASTSNISTRAAQWYHITKFWRMFLGTITVDGKIFIVGTSLRNYMLNYIKPISNRNKIPCGFKTCIRFMLFQSDLKKWKISQLEKLINYILIFCQLAFYRDPRIISSKTRLKYFQKCTYIFKIMWYWIIISLSLYNYRIKYSKMGLYFKLLFLLFKDECSIFIIIIKTSSFLSCFPLWKYIIYISKQI